MATDNRHTAPGGGEGHPPGAAVSSQPKTRKGKRQMQAMNFEQGERYNEAAARAMAADQQVLANGLGVGIETVRAMTLDEYEAAWERLRRSRGFDGSGENQPVAWSPAAFAAAAGWTRDQIAARWDHGLGPRESRGLTSDQRDALIAWCGEQVRAGGCEGKAIGATAGL